MIAIHHCAGPGSFSERWLSYCAERGIPHKVVDCYATDILAQLRGASALLWHWSQANPTDHLCARALIHALESLGLYVYPSTRTCWHFDDKVAQKYLLEGLGAPLVPAYVFFDREAALKWIRRAQFPKVFKLRCGAASTNVRLANNRAEATALCRTAFGRGFKPAASYFADFSTRAASSRDLHGLLAKLRRAPANVRRIWRLNRLAPRQRGYVYFQDFIPGNTHDTRVTIIGHRAFSFCRRVRSGDFRASGSGLIDWSPEQMDPAMIIESFRIARQLGSQSMAFDYLHGPNREPKVLEISYGFMPEPIHRCHGWWDEGLGWHPGQVWPQDAILEDVLAQSSSSSPKRERISPGSGVGKSQNEDSLLRR